MPGDREREGPAGEACGQGKCQTRFDAKLATLNAQATAAAIACRYVDNGDGTVMDYDTGLMWEQKTDDGSVHDKDNTYFWTATLGGETPDGTAFTAFLGTLNNGTSTFPATATSGCFAGHCDWRLPVIEELAGIVDLGEPGCEVLGSPSPCIDQTVFGPTVAGYDWSATTLDVNPLRALRLNFISGQVISLVKGADHPVRAVRSGL